MIDPGMFVEGVSLSRRQLQCLEWAARGKTIEGLGIKRPTAKHHLDRTKEKLGVETNVQAGIALKAKKDD